MPFKQFTARFDEALDTTFAEDTGDTNLTVEIEALVLAIFDPDPFDPFDPDDPDPDEPVAYVHVTVCDPTSTDPDLDPEDWTSEHVARTERELRRLGFIVQPGAVTPSGSFAVWREVGLGAV